MARRMAAEDVAGSGEPSKLAALREARRAPLDEARPAAIARHKAKGRLTARETPSTSSTEGSSTRSRTQARAAFHRDKTEALKRANTALSAAARFDVDDVIDPADTRRLLAQTLARLPVPPPAWRASIPSIRSSSGPRDAPALRAPGSLDSLGAVESLLGVPVGLALSTAAGLRVFVPLLITSAAARSGYIALTPGWTWVGSDAALVAFATASSWRSPPTTCPGSTMPSTPWPRRSRSPRA